MNLDDPERYLPTLMILWIFRLSVVQNISCYEMQHQLRMPNRSCCSSHLS